MLFRWADVGYRDTHERFEPEVLAWEARSSLKISSQRFDAFGVALYALNGLSSRNCRNELSPGIQFRVDSTFDAAEIGMRGVVSRDPANPAAVHLRVLINARDFVLMHQNNRYEGTLRLAVVGYLESGRAADAPVVPFELALRHGDLDHEKLLDTAILLKENVSWESAPPR